MLWNGTAARRLLGLVLASTAALLLSSSPVRSQAASAVEDTACEDQVTTCAVVEVSKSTTEMDGAFSGSPATRPMLPRGMTLARMAPSSMGGTYVYVAMPPMTLREARKRNVEESLRKTMQPFMAGPSATAQPRFELRPLLAQPSRQPVGNLQPQQGYLGPDGMDVLEAWQSVPGSDGRGVVVIDVERSWNLKHDDFPQPILGSGTLSASLDDRHHGTAVLGILGAMNDGKGIVGVSYGATLQYQAMGSCFGDSVREALDKAKLGDVVLIEAQVPQRCGAVVAPCSCNRAQCGYVPAEYQHDIFDAIHQATSWPRGVVVVEAGGNGSVDLDLVPEFLPSTTDSGAIIVGASQAHSGRPMCFSNFGSAIDLQGWGEAVATTGFGELYHLGSENSYYGDRFGGTSSAAAMVAGVAADLQSAAVAICSKRLLPDAILTLLRSTGMSTQSGPRYIGIRPDLSAAIKELQASKDSICTR
jgi:hypothetical protein